MGRGAILTWNLDGHWRQRTPEEITATRARIASCIHELAAQVAHEGFDRVVAVFQELPLEFEALVIEATGGTWTVRGRAQHHVAVVASATLVVKNVQRVGAPGAEQRALVFDVKGLLQEEVRLVGVHWLDRLYHPLGETRTGMNAVFWPNVRSRWAFPTQQHFLVLGDFNENPYDRSIVSKQHLWAIRDKSDLDGRSERSDGQPPLYNPMWQFLPEVPEPPHGTYQHLKNEESGVRWWNFDQILVSPSLCPLIDQVRILVEVQSKVLVRARGVPDKSGASDHLPVLATLKV